MFDQACVGLILCWLWVVGFHFLLDKASSGHRVGWELVLGRKGMDRIKDVENGGPCGGFHGGYSQAR